MLCTAPFLIAAFGEVSLYGILTNVAILWLIPLCMVSSIVMLIALFVMDVIQSSLVGLLIMKAVLVLQVPLEVLVRLVTFFASLSSEWLTVQLSILAGTVICLICIALLYVFIHAFCAEIPMERRFLAQRKYQ